MPDSYPSIIVFVLGLIIIILLGIIIWLYRKNSSEKVTEEDIITMVNEGHEIGTIAASEAEMIQNIFEFGDTDAKDIMVHRKNIVAVDGTMTLGQVIDFANEHSYSRYPVYLDDIDNIIGILHIKDLLLWSNRSEKYNTPINEIEGLLGTVAFVTETHGINTLFSTMQSRKNHMMVVVDEYGQTSGLLSLEDILEEIVGNIQDEHDQDEKTIEQTEEDTFSMDGSTTIEAAEELLGVKLTDDFETINGFLVNEIGYIPDEGSSFTVEAKGFAFNVINVTGKVIDKVIATRISEEKTDASIDDNIE